MRKLIAVTVVAALLTAGCAARGLNNSQRGAAVGAGWGAAMGQAIGGNMETTIIGAGVGMALGAILGDAEDQRVARWREKEKHRMSRQPERENRRLSLAPPPHREAPQSQVRAAPPGIWLTVPGHWEGNRWIPTHQEWRPVNPD